MTRDIPALTARTFDVLVIGGGVYGLTIACDAAQRGLSVALVERSDFGSGSSFNHLRTIHGGLRYLQSLDLRRSRESIRERRTLARIAPHAVQPLQFALPLYRSVMRGRLAMRAGLMLDRLVSADRNTGVPETHRLPPGRVVSAHEAIERFPGLRRRGLTGAATWYDYVTTEADRLTFSWALAAAGHGAVLANYVKATALLTEGKRIAGARVLDRPTGQTFEVSARLTINAAGGSTGALLSPLGLTATLPTLVAMNLVTTRDAGDTALGGLSESGRNFFLVPWRKRAVFGTWESNRQNTEDTGLAWDIERFITELNHAFPSLELSSDDVTLVHRGVVPAVSRPDGTVSLEGRDRVFDHAEDGIDGLMSVAGTKYTIARAVAERITDTAMKKLGHGRVASRTASTLLPGGDLGDITMAIAQARREFDATLPVETIPHLVHAYGSHYRAVANVGIASPALADRLAADSPVVGAQILWAVKHEMALTLSDAVVRRTPLGALGYPGDAAARRAADIMAKELGWTDDRTTQELRDLKRFYERS